MKKVRSGYAIIRKGFGPTIVAFHGVIALPFVHSIEEVKISVTEVKLSLDEDGILMSSDDTPLKFNGRADFIVNCTPEDVLQASTYYGLDMLNDSEKLASHLMPSLVEAIRTVCRKNTAEYLTSRENVDEVRDSLLQEMGSDFSGLVLVDLFCELSE